MAQNAWSPAVTKPDPKTIANSETVDWTPGSGMVTQPPTATLPEPTIPTYGLGGSQRIRNMATAPAGALTPMGSPPTLALAASVAPVGSTKPIAFTNAAFRPNLPLIDNGSGAGVPQAPLQADGVTRSGAWDGPYTMPYDFDGQYFSLRWNSTATRRFRIWVDEVPHAASLVLASSISGYALGGQWLNVDFGSRTPRRIMFEMEDQATAATWGSFMIDPRDSISPPSIPTSRLIFIGDSYVKGFNATTFSYSFALQCGRMLGIADTWSWMGQPSTGLVKVGAPYGNYQSKLADLLPNLPTSKAAVVICGSLNDSALAGVDTALIALVTSIKAQRPNIPIVVTSPLYTATPPAGYTTVRDTMQATVAALGTSVAGFVDLLPSFFGTGKSGTTTGDGNADYYRASDAIHATDAGHYYLARLMAQKLAPILGVTI